MDVPDDVVLIDETGRPSGRMDRATAHHAATPRHLGFSLYLLDDAGNVLVTRRSLAKRSWPGVWSNSCCGHPRPGEPWHLAVRRRLREELGIRVRDLDCVLPEFSYRARDAGGILEDEWCPTFVGRVAPGSAAPRPDPEEVAELAWTPASDLIGAVAAAPYAFSPWSVLQLAQLGSHLRRRATESAVRQEIR